MTLSFSVSCTSQTFMWIHRQSKFRCGGRLDGMSGTLGFPLERRVSRMLTTMLTAAVGVNRTLLQRLLGGWAFALTFRREVFACLDVSYTAAATLLPCRRCRVTRRSDSTSFCLSQGLLLCCRRSCGRNLCAQLFATDASPRGAGGCVAPITQKTWDRLGTI